MDMYKLVWKMCLVLLLQRGFIYFIDSNQFSPNSYLPKYVLRQDNKTIIVNFVPNLIWDRHNYIIQE